MGTTVYPTIQSAIDAASDGDTIWLDEGEYNNGTVNVWKNLTFRVSNGGTATITGNGTNRAVYVSPNVAATFYNIIFTNGSAQSGNDLEGAGLASDTNSVLTLRDCVVSYNQALAGAGLHSKGTTYIYNTLFIGNVGTVNWDDFGGGGGAIWNQGILNVFESTFTNNAAINGSAIYSDTSNVVLNFNRFVGNTGYYGYQVYVTGTTPINAENNWWGSNADPSSMVFHADANPWIMLTVNSSASQVSPGGTATVTADLNHNSDGATISGGHVPATVNFSSTLGTVNPASGTTANGAAATTFTAGPTVGAASVYATVDSQTSSTNINIIDTAPVVSSIVPANTATNVKPSTAITVTYSQNIQDGTGSIQLLDNNNNPVAFTHSIAGKVLTITPSSALGAGVTYTVNIPAGFVTNQYGTPAAASVTSFTTASTPTMQFWPDSGIYYNPLTIWLAASEPATIYYTTDGSNPTTSSSQFTSAFSLTSSKHVKFMCVNTAGIASAVYWKWYTIYASQAYSYLAQVRVWGKYKYAYKVKVKKWYRSRGHWRYKWTKVTKYKWKTGWHYVGVRKTATRWVLT